VVKSQYLKGDKIMGQLRVMGVEGDTKLIWDKAKRAEVDAARKLFAELKDKRYLAYAVKKSGEKGEIIREFDPDAEKIIMAPPIVGG
jgi:hypothetical protein